MDDLKEEKPTPDPEGEIKVLREKNTELVQKVQHWKILASQRENEKLDLMKELNQMRLNLSVSELNLALRCVVTHCPTFH